MAEFEKLENFIMYLLENHTITDCKMKRTTVRNSYCQYNAKKGKGFWMFLMELWKAWYVEDFNKTTVIFTRAWLDHFRDKILQKQLEASSDNQKYCNSKTCRACSVDFKNPSEYQQHKKLRSHKLRLKYLTDRSYFRKPEDVALKLQIQDSCNNTVSSVKSQTKKPINVWVTLEKPKDFNWKILEVVEINAKISEITTKVFAKPNLLLALNLRGTFENSCKFLYPIAMVLSNGKETECLLQDISFDITSEFSDLFLDGSYIHQKKLIHHQANTEDMKIIPGLPLEKPASTYLPEKPLKTYPIPGEVKKKIERIVKVNPEFLGGAVKNIHQHLIAAKTLNISTRLTDQNFFSHLNMLLYIEENQMQVDIKAYSKQDTLKHVANTRFYELRVPGLSEARPSLLRGDSVFVRRKAEDNKMYQGIVHKVLQESVHLGFNKKFSDVHLNKMKFFVDFGFNRRPVRVEHQGLEMAVENQIVSYFFPTKRMLTAGKKNFKQKELCYFSKNLNKEQKMAVLNILQMKPVPYLLFGPPGTGKTFTLVEAILQVWQTKGNSKILVCASSNSAANELAVRLRKIVPKSDIFRLFGSIYGYGLTDSTLSDISNIHQGDCFMPNMSDLLSYRIMICTMVTSARLINGGIPPKHYSYLFVDESGYSTETETIIPIVGALSHESCPGEMFGQVVLAGDPKQLGPRIHSTFSKFCGLETSMLERLMTTCEIYARDESNVNQAYDPHCITKLVKNYRSHSAILKIPNELFYHNELEAMGNAQSEVFATWECLKKANFPVLFHNVQGEDKQDVDSPSYYNIQELEVVVSYLSKLINQRISGMKLTESNIGIITPYRKQVQKLVQATKTKSWTNLQIGSVEQFQGREKLAIIISTVRSKTNKNMMNLDQKFELGFLRNPKRFNVAITRPKALLIIVGNIQVLSNDRYWRSLIQYCQQNDSVIGMQGNVADYTGFTENINDHDEGSEGVDFSRGLN